MVLDYIILVGSMLLSVSIIGYVLVVLKEKIYLKKHLIVIDKKSIKQEYIDENDMKEFMLGGIDVRSGDEVQVILKGNKTIKGIIIGAKRKENSIMVITHEDEVKRFRVNSIKRLKVISKYGRFFKSF